jgi:hypothetical protein
MMESLQLSMELQELERALAGRPLPGPSAHLRQKVLGGVRRRVPPERARARWRFAVAAAAGALVWLNLSLAAARVTDFGLRLNGPGESIETACRQIERLVPELSPQESRRQAILLRAGAALVPCPDLSSSGNIANHARPFLLEERREERSN